MLQYPASLDVPSWVNALEHHPSLRRLGKPSNLGMNWVHGAPEDRRLWIEYYADAHAKKMVGVAVFDDRAVGHPGYAHGGAIASVLDDILGTTAWLAGDKVFSANLSVDFRKHVPLRSFVRVDAQVNRVEGRKVYAGCRLTSSPDVLHAEAEGLFLMPRTDLR